MTGQYSGVLEEVSAKYNVDRKTVLLTGFSAGGFPMFYTGLRHPELFGMLVAMSCNSSDELFDAIPLTPEARRLQVIHMPVVAFWGRTIRGFRTTAGGRFSISPTTASPISSPNDSAAATSAGRRMRMNTGRRYWARHRTRKSDRGKETGPLVVTP